MTPKDIVDQIGNVANRPDLRELKRKMELQIEHYANEKAKQALDDEWKALHQWKPYLHHCYSAWDGLLIDRDDAQFMHCDCFEYKPPGAWQEHEKRMDAMNAQLSEEDFLKSMGKNNESKHLDACDYPPGGCMPGCTANKPSWDIEDL